MGILWVASSLLLLLIHMGPLPESALEGFLTNIGLNTGAMRLCLRIRLGLGAVFAVLVVAASVRRAFQKDPPSVSRIPLPAKASPSSAPHNLLGSLLYPFLLAFDALATACWVLSNALWLAFAMTAVYLFRIGAAMADYLYRLVLRRNLWTGVLRIATLYGLVYSFCRGLEAVAPPLERYLTTDSTIGTGYPEMNADLGRIVLFCVLLSLGITTHSIVFATVDRIHGPDLQWVRNSLHRQAFASATVSIAYPCGAGLVYTLVGLRLVRANGFDRLGPLTLGMAAAVAVVSVAFIISRLKLPKRR
jgi:hypothetical protein